MSEPVLSYLRIEHAQEEARKMYVEKGVHGFKVIAAKLKLPDWKLVRDWATNNDWYAERSAFLSKRADDLYTRFGIEHRDENTLLIWGQLKKLLLELQSACKIENANTKQMALIAGTLRVCNDLDTRLQEKLGMVDKP